MGRVSRTHAALQLAPVIGHRGAAARAPENTLAGLRRARALGCRWVEFDVRLTADGAPVLCHDRAARSHDRRQRPVSDAHSGGDSGTATPAAGSARALPASGCRPSTRLCCLPRARPRRQCRDQGRARPGTRDRRCGRRAVAAAGRPRRRRCWCRVFCRAALAASAATAPQIPRGVLFRLIPRGWAEIAARLGCTTIGADHIAACGARRVAADPRRRLPARRLHGQRPGAGAAVVRLGGDFRFFRRPQYNPHA